MSAPTPPRQRHEYVHRGLAYPVCRHCGTGYDLARGEHCDEGLARGCAPRARQRTVRAAVELPTGTRFPADMLRYDRCWPAQEGDSRYVGSAELSSEPVVVVVEKVTEKPLRASFSELWTLDRWRSFGVELREVGR